MRAVARLEDEFGDIVGKARYGLGWKVERLAQAIGIATVDLLEMDACRRRPNRGETEAIATALGLDPAKLWGVVSGWVPMTRRLPEGVVQIRGNVGGYAVQSYLFIDPATRQAAAVDTAANPEAILQEVASRGLNLRKVLLTHCHGDHAGGVEHLRKAGAVVHLHRHEVPLLGSAHLPEEDRFLEGEETIPIGNRTLRVLTVPGHTPGGLAFAGEGVCFTGDSLFAGSVGRAWTPSSYALLLEGVAVKILTLPVGYLLLPAHGPVTTVGEERRANPFFPVLL